MSHATREIIKAFDSGHPFRWHSMSWQTFLDVFDEIGRYRKENGK